ncbi:MAG: hypothetical protein DMF06_16235 [Verrucomicrobia bacterium]|nr:MAG: hypothetical protein DMF06_16235 [Verrucomicrobiota bacterium]
MWREAQEGQQQKKTAIMADEKTGKKPDAEGGAGVENTGAESAETETAEVGGRRHHRLLYTCWHDGAANRVHGHWSWFTCWRCGALNYM